MKEKKTDSIAYTNYRTICRIPEEISKECGEKSQMELTDAMYWQLKQKIMSLPMADRKKKIEQVNGVLQGIWQDIVTEESKKTIAQPKSADFFVKGNVLGEEKITATRKKDYNGRILALMKRYEGIFSRHLKQNSHILENARKYLNISSTITIYYMFDWSLTGMGTEGLALSAEGLHFKFAGSQISCGTIKWEELNQYDFQLQGSSVRLKKKNAQTSECFYFFEHRDAVNFFDVLEEMQKL